MPLPFYESYWNIFKFSIRKKKIEKILEILNKQSSI